MKVSLVPVSTAEHRRAQTLHRLYEGANREATDAGSNART